MEFKFGYGNWIFLENVGNGEKPHSIKRLIKMKFSTFKVFVSIDLNEIDSLTAQFNCFNFNVNMCVSFMRWLWHKIILMFMSFFFRCHKTRRRILWNQINYIKMFDLITSKSNLLLKILRFSSRFSVTTDTRNRRQCCRCREGNDGKSERIKSRLFPLIEHEIFVFFVPL